MTKMLIIAEKPSVARDIAQSLGGFSKTDGGFLERSDAIVSSGIGHLVALHVPEAQTTGRDLATLPVISERFALQVQDRTKSQFNLLAKLMKRADVSVVVNACDAGREGELVEVEVVGGERDSELGGGFQFGLRGDFLGIKRGIAGEKRGADHAVEGLAIIDFEVVGAGIGVAMPAQALRLAVEFENRLGGGEEWRQRVVGGEAAVVLGVVGEESVAAGEERGEVGVVGDGGEVVGGLLGVAKVGGKFGARTVTGVSGNRIRQRDAGIEGTNDDGLPAAARESADGDAGGVGGGVGGPWWKMSKNRLNG